MRSIAPALAVLLAASAPAQEPDATALDACLARYLEQETLDRCALREIQRAGAAAVPGLLRATAIPEQAHRAHRALRLLGPTTAAAVVPTIVASISKDYMKDDDDALATLAALAPGVADPTALDGTFEQSNHFAAPKPIAVDRDGWMTWLEKLKCWYRFRHRLVKSADVDLDDLVALLAEDDPLAREYAALRLGRLGSQASRAIDALETVRTTERHPRVTRCANGSLTADFHDEVRTAAAVAIARIDPFHASAVAGLERLVLSADDPDERSRAALMLGQRSAGLETLVEATRSDEDLQLVADALTALGMAGQATDAVLARLRELEDDPRPRIRKHAAVALRQLTK